jgi:predicted protein tyrosine phosphatase
MEITGIGPGVAGGIVVASLAQAQRHKRDFEGVLSLHDPLTPRNSRLAFNRQPAPLHLTLLFDDVENEEAAANAWQLPSFEQVAQALTFARGVRGRLLIHCHAGISRSGALGYAAIADRLGAGFEEDAMTALLRSRGGVIPNGLIVGFADRFLERKGALVAAYEAELAARPDWRQYKADQRTTELECTPRDFNRPNGR